MKVAIEGCAHGDLDRIYASVRRVQEQHNITIDLLICCGDFQSVRDKEDMENLTCKPEYRRMGDFHKYFTGERVAPVTTIFIGGNHEVPGFLRDLYYGGWVAPNMYYLGTAGVLRVGPLRIAGLSGQFKPQDFFTAHHECPPYTDTSRRSANNVREWDVARLARVAEPIDIVISHDWPRGIWKHGNVAEMLDHRDNSGDLRREMDQNSLGSLAAMELLKKLRPGFWFSAHLHTKFSALVPHEDGTFTRFLALDRCQPRKDFLQVIDVDPRSPSFLHRLPPAGKGKGEDRWHSKGKGKGKGKGPCARLDYDPEWLAIQKVNHVHLTFSTRNQKAMVVSPTREDIAWVVNRLREKFKPMPRKRSSLRRHSSLLPTKLREASGDKSFRDLSTSQLRELFETRGIEFPGHLDKASLTRQLEEHDEFFAAERNIEQTAADEAFPIPEDFVPDRENAASQRCALLELLEIHDAWKEQEDERRERMGVQISSYDPVREALTSEVDKDIPTSAAEQTLEESAVILAESSPSPPPSSPNVVDSPPDAVEEDNQKGSASTNPAVEAASSAAEETVTELPHVPESADADVGSSMEGLEAEAPQVSETAEAIAAPTEAQWPQTLETSEAEVDVEMEVEKEADAAPEAEEAEEAVSSMMEASPAEDDDLDAMHQQLMQEEAMMQAPDVAEAVSEAGYTSEVEAPVFTTESTLAEEEATLEIPAAEGIPEMPESPDALDDDAFAAFVAASNALENAEPGMEEGDLPNSLLFVGGEDGVHVETEDSTENTAVEAAQEAAVEADANTLPEQADAAAAEAEGEDDGIEGEIAVLEKVLAELEEVADTAVPDEPEAAADEGAVSGEIAALESALAELQGVDEILQQVGDEDATDFDPYALEELDAEPPAKAPRLA